MNNYLKLFAAVAVGAVFLLSGCGGKPSVHVTKAVLSTEPLTIETKAVPEALHTAPVIPSVSGGLISNPPDIGTNVTAGQVLFEIDSSQYQSQAAALQSQIAAASQRSAPSYAAPVDNSLEASLLKQGIITRAEYERIKGRNAPAAAPASGGEAAEALINSYQAIQRLIAGCTVRAPISGVISQVYIGDTHMAMAGKPALVIRQDSPVTASVEIPAKLDNVMEKAKDEKTLTVSLSDGSNVWYGELKPQPNDGGAITVYKVQADNPNDEITIGNEYNIRIESGQNVDAYLIPKSALIGEDTVAVVNDNNLVDMKTVSVASETGGYLLIMDGLSDGDRVITDPTDKLEMGMEVSASES